MKRILLGTLLFVSIISINQIAFAIDGNVRVNVFNRAIKNGNIEKVQEYINKGFDPNETYLGGAVICTAIQKRQNEMLDFLLANGANANNPKSQVQPLYYAVAKKNPYAVEKLLLAGADQSKTFMGHTAEEFARIQNYTDIITVFEKFNNSNIAQNRIKKKNDKFCGIGVQLYKDKNKIFAIKVLKNSPAEKVYFPVGAEIIEIDNIKVKKMSIDDVQEMIRGENKTYVNVLAKSSSGKRIYKIQRDKCFPLPTYDLSVVDRVKVTIYGKILDNNYTQLLHSDTELDMGTIFLLDKIQKREIITKDNFKLLRKRGLVEGRYPNIYVSFKIADIVGQRVEYVRNKGLDDDICKQLIKKALEKMGQASKQELMDILDRALPNVLTDEQKSRKVSNLLQSMKNENIVKVEGKTRHSKWSLK